MASFRILEHEIESSYIREWPHALANNQEDRLYLSVKQYIPKDNPNPRPGDVTIIGAHANGFPKGMRSYTIPAKGSGWTNKLLQNFMSHYGTISWRSPKSTTSASDRYGSQTSPTKAPRA